MAALPPSNTARLWIDYTLDGQAHSIMLRYATTAEAAANAPNFRALAVANASNFFNEVTFTGARVADPGSNVSNPVIFGEPVTGTGGAIPGIYPIVYADIVGRDTGGHKLRAFLYGIADTSTFPDNFRLSLSADRDFSRVMSDLRDLIEESNAVTIGGSAPVLSTYCNIGLSAYYQRKGRTG